MEIKLEKVTVLKDKLEVLKEIELSFNAAKISTILSSNQTELETFSEILTKVHKTSSIFFSKKKPKIGASFAHPEEMFFKQEVKDEFFISKRMTEKNLNKVKEIFNELGIDIEILNQNPFTLSDGEQRKVSIALAIFNGEDLIVLLNPTYGLDTKSIDKLIKYLKKLRKNEKKTIISLTSKENFALRISDDVILIKDAKVILEGEKYDVLSNEMAMEEAFLKVPDLLRFVNVVKEKKGIDIGYRDEINDLLKDIYRYVN